MQLREAAGRPAAANQDGLTIEDSRNVRISNCYIHSGDDALVFKSERRTGNCENIAVSNCVISSNASAIKFGTRSDGGSENVTINNCAIYDTRITGIALESVDGGTFDRVIVSNIVMKNIKSTAIFVRLGHRGEEGSRVGSMRNVIISNVQGTGIGVYDPARADAVPSNFSTKMDGIMARCNIGCSITGIPGFPVENVTIDNVRLHFAGAGTHRRRFNDSVTPEPMVAVVARAVVKNTERTTWQERCSGFMADCSCQETFP